MRIAILVATTLTLSGCLNSAALVQLPDGSQGFTIERCRSMNACYNKAAALCGGKYDVVDSAARTFGSTTVVNGIGAGSSGTAFEIIVKCKT
jgi:hypothetical protein